MDIVYCMQLDPRDNTLDSFQRVFVCYKEWKDVFRVESFAQQ